MQYNSLFNWYQNAFMATQLNKLFTLTEYEKMYPFEFDLYSTLLQQHEQTEADKLKQQNSLAQKLEEQGY